MKKLFIIPLLSFTISLFSSCSTTYSLYSTPLNNVQRVIYSNNSSPLTSTINYSNIEDKYGYEDEIVKKFRKAYDKIPDEKYGVIKNKAEEKNIYGEKLC